MKRLLLISIFAISLGACSHLQPVSPYDSVSFKTLTDLKPVVLSLYGTFSGPQIDQKSVDNTRMKLTQEIEYESSKGVGNEDVKTLVSKIRDNFDRHLDSRKTEGPWSQKELAESQLNMTTMFDTAIKAVRVRTELGAQ